MRRYLLYLSYSGTRLRGVQKQPGEGVTETCKSVQGFLDTGLLRLNPSNIPQSYISSRTDAGVHAIQNAAHVDLCREREGTFYPPKLITKVLNSLFIKENVDIRVRHTREVPSNFHSRFHAAGRSYLYRLAVIKPESEDGQALHYKQYLPPAELHRLYVVRPPFDIEKVLLGCQMLEGKHNFASFMKTPTKGSTYTVYPNRDIDSITCTRSRPLLDQSYDPLYSNLDFWDFNISAKSFLYKQVRRIVGALVAVAQGKLTLDDIQWLLDNPSPKNWKPQASTAPPEGLFLLRVKYHPEVFEETFHSGNIDTTKATAIEKSHLSDSGIKEDN
ncbi:tRNA pseudouridine synthase-like 1 [Halocaridina rubra]|uniref:tRNA pseudouridine synthase n=1 Tax=Halocaridina rubra TaxID=373956 RepID=A0AAN9AD26_HALRR